MVRVIRSGLIDGIDEERLSVGEVIIPFYHSLREDSQSIRLLYNRTSSTLSPLLSRKKNSHANVPWKSKLSLLCVQN